MPGKAKMGRKASVQHAHHAPTPSTIPRSPGHLAGTDWTPAHSPMSEGPICPLNADGLGFIDTR